MARNYFRYVFVTSPKSPGLYALLALERHFCICLHRISWPCLTQALSKLELLTQLNLSENFLNGPLSEHAGKLTRLEVINLDINNITVLCPEVRNWTALRIFTISDNSLSGE
jgi:hypothetical protein